MGLVLALDHYSSVGFLIMRVGSFLAKRGFVIAAPDLERNWCNLRRPTVAGLLQRLRRLTSKTRPRGRVLPLVAFRRGKLACTNDESGDSSAVNDDPRPSQCFHLFRITARQ